MIEFAEATVFNEHVSAGPADEPRIVKHVRDRRLVRHRRYVPEAPSNDGACSLLLLAPQEQGGIRGKVVVQFEAVTRRAPNVDDVQERRRDIGGAPAVQPVRNPDQPVAVALPPVLVEQAAKRGVRRGEADRDSDGVPAVFSRTKGRDPAAVLTVDRRFDGKDLHRLRERLDGLHQCKREPDVPLTVHHVG